MSKVIKLEGVMLKTDRGVGLRHRRFRQESSSSFCEPVRNPAVPDVTIIIDIDQARDAK